MSEERLEDSKSLKIKSISLTCTRRWGEATKKVAKFPMEPDHKNNKTPNGKRNLRGPRNWLTLVICGGVSLLNRYPGYYLSSGQGRVHTTLTEVYV
jgi:hypothetical protein